MDLTEHLKFLFIHTSSISDKSRISHYAHKTSLSYVWIPLRVSYLSNDVMFVDSFRSHFVKSYIYLCFSVFKASTVLSTIFVMEAAGVIKVDHNILFASVIIVLMYFRLCMVWGLMSDPFVPFENLICSIVFGGMWDAYQRVMKDQRNNNAVSANGDSHKLKRSWLPHPCTHRFCFPVNTCNNTSFSFTIFPFKIFFVVVHIKDLGCRNPSLHLSMIWYDVGIRTRTTCYFASYPFSINYNWEHNSYICSAPPCSTHKWLYPYLSTINVS